GQRCGRPSRRASRRSGTSLIAPRLQPAACSLQRAARSAQSQQTTAAAPATCTCDSQRVQRLIQM
ncbi:MAG: hypothetical protein AVDCRST_MAG71-1396, partial [uncultured Lysobacter sp.]